MSIQKIVIGCAAGVLAGLTAGLLLAPEKGADTREKIMKGADDLKEKLRSFNRKDAPDMEDLKKIFSTKIKGLSDEAREEILSILSRFAPDGSARETEEII